MNPNGKDPSAAQLEHEQSPVSGEDDWDDPDDFQCKSRLPAASPDDCCRNKCVAKLDDGFKSRLKSDLSTLKRTEKLIYLFSLLSINEEVKNRPKGLIKSSNYFQYTVKEYGVLRPVCKTAFIAIHDTTPGMVRNLCNKLSAGYLIPTDERGRHERQPTISEHTKELIKSHFSDTLQSPTIFKCVKKRLGQPNINQLWLDFKQKYGYISLSTYSKYIRAIITPDVLKQFMSANEAKQLLNCIKDYEKKVK